MAHGSGLRRIYLARGACNYTGEGTYPLESNDAQKRNLGVWEGEGVSLLENRTGVESVAYVTNSTRRGT